MGISIISATSSYRSSTSRSRYPLIGNVLQYLIISRPYRTTPSTSQPIYPHQCAKERVEYEYRITQVLAHGLLHLLGYDHHTRPEYRQMRRMENRLIAAVDAEERKLGVIPASDPNFVSYPPMPDDDLDGVTDDTTVDSKRR